MNIVLEKNIENIVSVLKNTAMFYYFKETGKYYTEAFGLVPEKSHHWTRKDLIEVNGGKMPGLSTLGYDFRVVVIPSRVLDIPQILEMES